MKADHFNMKEYTELIAALHTTSSDDEITNEIRDSILAFFEENKELDYNSFLSLYNDKYGNIIKQHREIRKIKALSNIRFASILYSITFFVGIISAIIWIIIMISE